MISTIRRRMIIKSLIIVFAAGCVLSIIEGMLYSDDLLELYAGSILMTISVFMLAIKNENFGRGTFINCIGKNYSMVIYVIHILVGMLLSRFITTDWAGYGWIKPLIIAFLSLVIAMIYDKMKIAFCKRG